MTSLTLWGRRSLRDSPEAPGSCGRASSQVVETKTAKTNRGPLVWGGGDIWLIRPSSFVGHNNSRFTLPPGFCAICSSFTSLPLGA